MDIILLLSIPAGAAALAAVLILMQRVHARGFAEGVASAQLDPVTRLPATPVAQQILAMEFAAAERGRPLTVVLFDIDNFRRIAPLGRGAVGNKVLLAVGAILRRRTRGMNVSARFDNAGLFIAVLGGVSARGAETFVQRVRKDLNTVETGYQPLVVSTSVCEYRPNMQTLDDMMANAYGTLAEAKAKGGNQVIVHE